MDLSNYRNRVRHYLQQRYDTSGRSEVERYYGEQMAYGHREVLLDFMEVDRKYYFKASLTHGKILPDRLDSIKRQFDQQGKQVLQALWRSDAEIEAKRKGIKAISIGATGLYALQNMGHSIGAIKNNLADFSAQHTWSDSEEVILDLMKDKKVLYMPLHSWEGDVVNQINNDVSLLKFLNPRRVTVLMGFLDFVDFESRHFFESMGFTTECAGIRASKIFGSPAGGRETFLYTLFKIISEHDYVVANGLTTGLLYAACLKKNVGILPALQSPRIKYSSWRNQDEFAADIDRQRAFFPWLISTSSTDKSKIQNDLYEALGVEKCKTQSQLFDCLPLMLKE